MRQSQIKKFILAVVFSSVSLVIYAQDSKQTNDVFIKSCVDSWMNTQNISDKVEFKNFGEKYCSCVATKPMDTDDEMTKTAQVCMSQVMLHDTMDTLEDQEGLEDLTETKIKQGCLNKWNFIAGTLVGDEKGKADTYCECAAPKLMSMNKNREDLTDKDWTDKINSIAEACSDKVAADKSTVSKAKS